MGLSLSHASWLRSQAARGTPVGHAADPCSGLPGLVHATKHLPPGQPVKRAPA